MAKVKCPRCRKEIEYDQASPFRPFCCERCQLLDLGKWAEEGYAIPGEKASELVNQNPDEDGSDPEESGASPRLH